MRMKSGAFLLDMSKGQVYFLDYTNLKETFLCPL